MCHALKIGSGLVAQLGCGRALMADSLQLLDDLGWAEHDPRDSFELTMPQEALDTILDRFREGAEAGVVQSARHLVCEESENVELLATIDAIRGRARGEVGELS